ncbi:unnamed protein product [Candidula unifasciata]|uniref:Adapter molecule Crk n=1 Tax=Candidula unifasciata TaxID=100452 RepID=A0A8S3ZXY0_9EUPU|nr:unnamed protein product [Candidula unifasciata]
MDSEFDPEDKYSWYFGMLSREKTNEILMEQDYDGTFLVRDSKSCQGDFVLCVREDQKVSHYIVNRIQSPDGTAIFKIGDKEFSDMPSLLSFYKTHYLETTTLIKPVPRTKLVCKYKFDGRDPEDLPFKKGDILEVIYKDEEEWWTAINTDFRIGQIPAQYTEVLEDSVPSSRTPVRPPPPITNIYDGASIKLPAKAVVILQRIPSAYDKRMLKLEVGEVITVLKMNQNGQWEGRDIRDREGIFPFTHIRFLTEEELHSLPGST